jgi:tetratricopeptide (TPR) repeat protein
VKRASAAAGYSREAVLVICLLLLLVLFSITAVVTRLYHHKIQSLADQWFGAGEANYQSHNMTAALVDYRNALVYSPNSLLYQFHLARALVAGGRGDEARSYLINLLAESPGSGEINLELARIAARQNQKSDALLYFHSAIYGVWDQDPLGQRWNVRRELCEYLLKAGDVKDVQPDLIALAQEVPPGDIQRQKEAASLLLRAGVRPRALEEYQSILKSNPSDEDALAGAGTAGFELGQYARAVGYLDRLPRDRLSDPRIGSMLETSRQVESANPFLPGLPASEKAKRTVSALQRAQERISDCAHQHGESTSAVPPVSQLQTLFATGRQKMANDWTEAALRRNPELVDPAMSLVFEMEDAAAQECGASPAGPDRILVLIARGREAANP